MNDTLILLNEDEYRKYIKTVLPTHSSDEDHIVYWLYDDTCKDLLNEGYVGVTTLSRQNARFLEHKRSGRFPENIQMKVLQINNAEACYMYERCLRPYPNLGWNIALGGARGNYSGIPFTEERKRKIGDANKGNKRKDLSEYNRRNNSIKFKDLTCPHCGKFGSGPTMMRYHFKNCKHKNG